MNHPDEEPSIAHHQKLAPEPRVLLSGSRPRRGGQAFAWGWNQHRELGSGTDLSTTTPAPVIELAGVSAIAAGEFHSLALQTANSPPPTLEVSPGIGSLAVRWRSDEESQRWIVQWRQAGTHAKWSPLIHLPSTARSYTLTGLGIQAYEVLVRNSGFGTRIISGKPLT
jgi:regulator of chromosome condensation (RCC1) repeat-containing protein